MNAVVDFPYNFRLRVKFTTHMMNSTGAKIGLNCTKYFRSIVLLVLAHTIALNKFRLYSFRKQTINLVLMIRCHFSFWLQFNIYKKCVFQGFTKILLNNVRGTSFNFLSSDQVLLLMLDGGFCFLGHPLCFNTDKSVRRTWRNPPLFPKLFRV